VSKKIVIVYHSGYGHTRKIAEAVAAGSGAALLAPSRPPISTPELQGELA
jgi:flavodoxin